MNIVSVGAGFAAGVVSSLMAQWLWTSGEPWVKQRRNRSAERRMRAQGQQALTDNGNLRIGTTVIPWIVCAFGPWTTDQILCFYNAKPIDYPPAIKDRVRALTQEIQQRDRLGERVPFNGLGYQLESFDVSGRTATQEEPVLKLRFHPTDYFAMLATDHDLDSPLVIRGQGTTLRREFAQGTDLRIRPVTAFATHFGVAIQVITSDGLMIISERGLLPLMPMCFSHPWQRDRAAP